MKNFILTLLFFAGIVSGAQAQQYPLFSHYLLNDYAFNPAQAGQTDYLDMRFVYRTQWVGIDNAPQTQVLSANSKIKNLPIGVGGFVFNDQAGLIKRTGGSVSASFVQQLTEKVRASVGVNALFTQLRLDDQFVAGDPDVDPTIVNGSEGTFVPEFSAGVMVRSSDGWFIGLSVPQIFETQIDFTQDVQESFLNRHYYLMGGYKIPVSDGLAVEPSIMFKYFQTSDIQYEGSLRLFFQDKFWIGGSYRTGGAAVGLLGAELNKRFTLAYAYDMAASALNDVNSGSHEITLGLRLGKCKDSDEDGICDEDDKCPEEPGTEENEGCPTDPLAENDGEQDTDGDGVLDKDDDCPRVPGLKDNKGCPYGDRDNDGIRDDVDQCPDVAGLANNNGCPLNDRDQDGIVDGRDKCPDTPGSMMNEGCPDLDSDGDGVMDSMDDCPTVAGFSDNRGCPRATRQERALLELAIRWLYFDYDQADLQPEAYQYLDQLAEVLVNKPHYRVKLRGFADERGTEQYNLNLSKRRVEAVYFYLINRGVSASQLTKDYFGEKFPNDNRNNEEGYQRNRRVELEFVW